MFSELLFLRFNGILEHRAAYLIDHLSAFHRLSDRHCCVVRDHLQLFLDTEGNFVKKTGANLMSYEFATF
jgi:hypothetical protein